MKSIVNMSNEEAKFFLLKEDSYSSINLPTYFNFTQVIKMADEQLNEKKLNDFMVEDRSSKLNKQEKVNYTLITNKDGLYNWRPLTLIHPLVYVDLVNTITEKDSWMEIVNHFKLGIESSIINCVSLPVESDNDKPNQAEIILNWWKNFEQLQIELSLGYKYCMHADISNCYGSIYTHTIPWALHTRNEAKRNRECGIGNEIDKKIQDMQYGQTNGIPQGSVLMDLVAEIVLKGVDLEFEAEISEHLNNNCGDIKIIRYRDDYRIFSNNKTLVEWATKKLTEILLEWNFKLNSNKTFLTDDIILNSVKEDKLYWTLIDSSIKSDKSSNIPYKVTIQKHLLQVKILASKYPNSGSLKTALTSLYKLSIDKLETPPEDIIQLISILVNIMENNPKVVEHCVSILSKLLDLLEPNEAIKVIDKIKLKFETYPNTEFVNIWLQRLAIPYQNNLELDFDLGKKVENPESIDIWRHEWLKKPFDETSIIDKDEIDELEKIIDVGLLDLFNSRNLSEDI